MKICMIAKSLPIHITGGMEKHVKDLTDGLIDRGHELTILTAPHPKGTKKEQDDNLKIFYLDSKPEYFRRDFYKESSKFLRKNEQEFDIIHSQSTLGVGYPKYCGKENPFIVTSHGTVLNEIKTLLSAKYPFKYFLGSLNWIYIYFLVEPLVFNEADRIISPSWELRDDIASQHAVAKDKIDVIPHGIDTGKYSPKSNSSELREKYNLEKNKKVVLAVGRMVKSKGYHILLKAFSKVLRKIDAELFIVGTGGDLDFFRKKAKELDITEKVTFTGKISNNELIKLYGLSDLFVHPTLWHSEVFGYVIAEAMACGTPVIASRIGGVPTVVDDGDVGYLFEPGNVSELKDKMKSILGDEKLASEMSEKSRRRAVEKFSIDRMVEDTEAIYKEVLENWEQGKRK